MSEKTDTGKDVMDKTKSGPFDAKRQELLTAIETYQGNILETHKRIELIDSLQSIIKIVSGAKVVHLGTFRFYGDPLVVSLPDIETLGTFLRELEHLKSKIPTVELTYSGKIAGDEVLAEVKIAFKD